MKAVILGCSLLCLIAGVMATVSAGSITTDPPATPAPTNAAQAVAGLTFAGTVRNEFTMLMTFNEEGTAFSMLVSWTKSGSFDCTNITFNAQQRWDLWVPAFFPINCMQDKACYCVANALLNNAVTTAPTVSYLGADAGCNGNPDLTCHSLRVGFVPAFNQPMSSSSILIAFTGLDGPAATAEQHDRLKRQLR